MLSRSWTPDPSEDINPQVTRDAENSRDQSYIFSLYLPFLGFLRWVRLYLCSQESFANDVSTGCLSYFCILGEYRHREPFLLLCLFQNFFLWKSREMYRSLGRNLYTAISRILRIHKSRWQKSNSRIRTTNRWACLIILVHINSVGR